MPEKRARRFLFLRTFTILFVDNQHLKCVLFIGGQAEIKIFNVKFFVWVYTKKFLLELCPNINCL